jgi:hypothetical protein
MKRRQLGFWLLAFAAIASPAIAANPHNLILGPMASSFMAQCGTVTT